MIQLLLATVLTCQFTPNGPVDVYAVAYYEHESPIGERYHAETVPMTVDSQTVTVSAEGSPVAFEVYAHPHGVTPADWQLVKTCGDVPDAVYPGIFSHGFEGGTAMGWGGVVP